MRRTFCDFAIRFDPKTDSKEDVARRILYSIYVKRIKNKKPVVTFMGGDSGDGKSWGVLRLMEVLSEVQGFKLIDVLNACNVYVPIEYPKKLDNLLFDKSLKKVNMLAIHEAREVVKAKNWHSFLNTAISDVNAMSRSVKRLMTFIISQFIRDIDSSIRYTITYYIKAKRPLQKKTRLSIFVMWKDDRDLEKPKLRKRRLSGYLIYPDGTYKRFVPSYLELNKPSKEVTDIFEKSDREAKAASIRHKMDKLIKDMQKEMDVDTGKVPAMVEFYTKNLDLMESIGKRYKKGWRMKPDFKKMHELSKEEVNRFETMLNDKLKEKGVINDNKRQTKTDS